MTDPTVAAWPLLLSGPMLRRVEPKLVSVFVLTKHSREVKLDLFLAGRPSDPPLASQTAQTISVRHYAHACVVTAVPASSLAEATSYAYNITLTRTGSDPLDTGPAVQTLDALGLLTGATPLGYDAQAFPTFALPPADVGDLKFVHASCRKPHADGMDALCALDTIIENTRSEPLQRPHQAFFTGDQIYADDVAQPLLAHLTRLGNRLLSWVDPEIIPTVNKTTEELLPGTRQAVMDAAHFSSTAADSHLMSLGEFFAMYASVWSDALWPAQLPAFGERNTPGMPSRNPAKSGRRGHDVLRYSPAQRAHSDRSASQYQSRGVCK